MTEKTKIIVESQSIDGIVDALDIECVQTGRTSDERADYPDELTPVLETLADIYQGVRVATEEDERGRSRKVVHEYADRNDLDSDEVGHLLRVLEAHDLVVQDGNRWRIDKVIE